MNSVVILRVGFFALSLAPNLVDHWRADDNRSRSSLTRTYAFIWLAANLGFVIFLFINHIGFPLHLEVMEGTILQHVDRAIKFEPIYPPPSPEFVPLAYNPLFYYLAVPFASVQGVSLIPLRLTAILGTLGLAAILYAVVREKTGSSRWWGFVSIGLLAVAYRTMDVYFDTAHSDSWSIFAAMLGTLLIASKNDRSWREYAGIIALVASFWFKQHGALFVAGGLIFLTIKHGVSKSLIYWVVAGLLGPGIYFLAGPALFGPEFFYYTLVIPGQWTSLNLGTFSRLIQFAIKSYPTLIVAAIWYGIVVLKTQELRKDAWIIQSGAAFGTAFIGALDSGSSNNVFIPMGVWIILLGTIGLSKIQNTTKIGTRYRLGDLLLVVSFPFLLYNPINVVVPNSASTAYEDLITQLDSLDAQVYAPWQGYLGDSYDLYPKAHWVALEDLIRGPGRDTSNHPSTRKLLAPVISPSAQNAYILTNFPLNYYPWLEFLGEYYTLEVDFGERFKSLKTLPARWDHGWPRYLYIHKNGQ